MRRARTWLTMSLLLALIVSGCGREGLYPPGTSQPTPPVGDDDDDNSSGLPQLDYTPPPFDDTFGDGRDGDVTLSNGDNPVNQCFELLGTNGDTVTLDDWDMAQPAGRMVLLLQTQDQTSPGSGDQNPVTDPADLGSAGSWELSRVVSATANGNDVDLQLDPPPKYGFGKNQPDNDGRSAQACTVPEYRNLTIPDGTTLQANSFQQSLTDGIVFVLVSEVLTIDGEVDADGAGFRGQGTSNNDSTDDVTQLDTSANRGGSKGQGLDARSAFMNGRGNFVNAAGGGNGANAGGGGGGNGGFGGIGGKQGSSVGDEPNTRGLPGVAIEIDPVDRLILGGAGAGGQQDNSRGGAGGNGGGLILLHAKRLRGSGAIHADGESGETGGATFDNGDGAGGGGAGGTIWIKTRDDGFDGAIEALGGDGGDCRTDNSTLYGVGGGGGGGTIFLQGLDADLALADGGQRGLNLDNGNDPHDSQDGQPGRVIVAPEF